MAVARIDALADESHARVTEVVARHERTLLRVARQASLCHDDALDAYQRALEIFVRRVDTVDRATEVAWLKVVVRHEAMAIRRARVESVAGDELDLDAFVPAVGAQRRGASSSSEERVRRSAEALRALKPDEAKALMMKAHGLSYAEIGERNGWSYTKVNRAVTEGRRRFINTYNGIEAGEECERFEPIVQALSAGSATTAQVLQIRPHLRHCNACRATVRELHVSRLRRASLFSPIVRPHQPQARDRRAVPPSPGVRPRHRHRARQRRRRRPDRDGRRRARSVPRRRRASEPSASSPATCRTSAATSRLECARSTTEAPQGAPTRSATRSARATGRHQGRVVVGSRDRATPAPKPKASTARARRREAKKEAAPREFGFENQAPAASTAEPSATTAIPTPTDADQDGVQDVQPRRAGVLAVMSRLKAVLTALFYCVVASTTLRLLCLPAALCVLFVVPSTTHAQERAVGTYAVANCWSDREGRSVSAFTTHFATQGHEDQVRLRAATEPGLRGVVTQNIPGKGRVKAGSMAEVSIVAPPGTEMLEFTWDARLRRVDCRYAMQAWAAVPGSKPITLRQRQGQPQLRAPRARADRPGQREEALHSRGDRRSSSESSASARASRTGARQRVRTTSALSRP